MLFSGIGVFAEEPEVVGNEDYTVTFSADEITDVSILTEMIKSEQNCLAAPKQSFYVKNNSENDNTVYQLLTEKTYRNGDVEREYVSTKLVSRETYYTGAATDSDFLGDTVIKHSFYYSWYEKGGITGSIYMKPLRIVSTVAQKGINDSVFFRHMYNVSWQGGVYELDREQLISSPTVRAEYTLNVIALNGVSPQYLNMNSGVVNMYSGVELTVNGKSIEIKVSPW